MSHGPAPRRPAPRRARPPGAAGQPKEGAPPFDGPLDQLEAWFEVLGPPRFPDESPASLDAVLPIHARAGFMALLLARTEATEASGVVLPFEAFLRANGLDLLDRLLLLALLRNAHDPQGEKGIKALRLFHATGADTLARRHEVVRRLEEEGRLRDVGAVQSVPDDYLCERRYRLAPHLVEPLTTGGGDPEGIPVLSGDPIQDLEEVAHGVERLCDALLMQYPQTQTIWSTPIPGGPGWDHMGVRRRKLAARLEASARVQADPIGAEIRRLGLEGEERLVWASLVRDSQTDEPGMPVPQALRLAGRHPDPDAAAARLLGPESKLARADALRFNRRDGSLLSMAVWLSREARARVIPWPRTAFLVRGASREEGGTLSRVGFDSSGELQRDHAAARGGDR